MKSGFRWVLGDGNLINIYDDPWLREKENFKVDNSVHPEGANAKVCDFFRHDRKAWDEDKIRRSFNDGDASVILTTRIPQNGSKDRLAWVHSHNGQYSVKMGYQYWHSNHLGNINVKKSDGWGKLWRLSIPHKIKVYLWRFCRNCPIQNLLRGKGVAVTIECQMC